MISESLGRPGNMKKYKYIELSTDIFIARMKSKTLLDHKNESLRYLENKISIILILS